MLRVAQHKKDDISNYTTQKLICLHNIISQIRLNLPNGISSKSSARIPIFNTISHSVHRTLLESKTRLCLPSGRNPSNKHFPFRRRRNLHRQHKKRGILTRSEVLLLAPKNLLKKNIDLNKDWKYNKEQKANPYGSLRFGALYLLFWVLPLLPKILAGK